MQRFIQTIFLSAAIVSVLLLFKPDLLKAKNSSLAQQLNDQNNTDSVLTNKLARLGELIFEDQKLSLHENQSCASCHEASTGFTAPDMAINKAGSVMHGSNNALAGNTKPPSAAYAHLAPVLHHKLEGKDMLMVGGSFNNGRATGKLLGNPVADQALEPFLNPFEMALPHMACVVQRVCNPTRKGYYSTSLPEAGNTPDICQIDFPTGMDGVCKTPDGKISLAENVLEKVNTAYNLIGRSLLAFQASSKVSKFNSKFDRVMAGKDRFSEEEQKGFDLFKNKGKCADCHVLDPAINNQPPVFTDFTYDNLGVPRNPENPFYTQKHNSDGKNWVDKGLATTLGNDHVYAIFAPENQGKIKVPTLRNVAKKPSEEFVKAYMHNGYFKSLKSVVHFYNTRDVKPRCKDKWTNEADALKQGCWPEAEMEANKNTDEMGNLKLTDAEENAIVTFMKTLDDQD